MNNLIACQPSAIKAVRLQCLVPPHPEKIVIRDLLDKDEVHIAYIYSAREDSLEPIELDGFKKPFHRSRVFLLLFFSVHVLMCYWKTSLI